MHKVYKSIINTKNTKPSIKSTDGAKSARVINLLLISIHLENILCDRDKRHFRCKEGNKFQQPISPMFAYLESKRCQENFFSSRSQNLVLKNNNSSISQDIP